MWTEHLYRIERWFEPTPKAVGEARRFCRSVLGKWGVATAGDVLVVVSELVCNAVVHGRTDFRLALVLWDGSVAVEVADGELAPPEPLDVTHDAAGGRGLRLVQELSGSWGWHPVPGGKQVWAAVPLPAGAPLQHDKNRVGTRAGRSEMSGAGKSR